MSTQEIQPRKSTTRRSTSTRRGTTSRSNSRRENEEIPQQLPPPSNRNTIYVGKDKEGELSVMPSRYLNATGLMGTQAWDCLAFQEWLEFATHKTEICDDLVRFFNRHVLFNYGENGSSVSMVIMCGRTRFSYGDTDFFQDFDMPDEGWYSYSVNVMPEDMNVDYNGICRDLNESQWDGCHTVRHNLSPCASHFNGEMKFLFRVLRDVILPSNSNDTLLTQTEGMMMYRLRHNMKINLPMIIARHIQDAHRNLKKKAYPYGMLITHMCQKMAIPLYLCGQASMYSAKVINKSTWNYQHLVWWNDRLLQPWEVNKLPQEERDTVKAAIARRKKRGTNVSSSSEEEAEEEPADADEVNPPPAAEQRNDPVQEESYGERLRRIERIQREMRAEQRRANEHHKNCFTKIFSILRCHGKKDDVVEEEVPNYDMPPTPEMPPLSPEQPTTGYPMDLSIYDYAEDQPLSMMFGLSPMPMHPMQPDAPDVPGCSSNPFG